MLVVSLKSDHFSVVSMVVGFATVHAFTLLTDISDEAKQEGEGQGQ